MHIAGRRADGALYLSLGVGIAVVLKGDRVSAPLDESIAETMGPWTPVDAPRDMLRDTERAMNRARVVTTDYLLMETRKGPVPGEESQPGEEKKVVTLKEKDGDEDVPVSDVAAMVPDDKKKSEVINLPPSDNPFEKRAADVAAVAVELPPIDPAVERKKKREALRDKLKGEVRAKRRIGDVLSDEEISDDELYAMAKELGMSDETPGVMSLNDNSNTFHKLLASTGRAQYVALAGDPGEHPFQWCMDHVIPAMTEEGKTPDDPNAFCAWWKAEKA